MRDPLALLAESRTPGLVWRRLGGFEKAPELNGLGPFLQTDHPYRLGLHPPERTLAAHGDGDARDAVMSKPRRLPIDERLEEAGKLVIRSRIFFDVWSYFEDRATRRAIIDTMDRFSEYFRFDSHAHFVAFIIHIAALFETRKQRDTINLPDLVKELKQSNQISAQTAAEVEALLSQAAPWVPKVIILRSNLFAHRNAFLSYDEPFKKAAVTPGQMRELTEIALTIVNHLQRSRGVKECAFHTLAREDTEALLKALKETR
jgi:HEPN superfamily AbiU2-like protein